MQHEARIASKKYKDSLRDTLDRLTYSVDNDQLQDLITQVGQKHLNQHKSIEISASSYAILLPTIEAFSRIINELHDMIPRLDHEVAVMYLPSNKNLLGHIFKELVEAITQAESTQSHKQPGEPGQQVDLGSGPA